HRLVALVERNRREVLGIVALEDAAVAAEREVLKELAPRAEVAVQLDDGVNAPPPVVAEDLLPGCGDLAGVGPLRALGCQVLLIVRRAHGRRTDDRRRWHGGRRRWRRRRDQWRTVLGRARSRHRRGRGRWRHRGRLVGGRRGRRRPGRRRRAILCDRDRRDDDRRGERQRDKEERAAAPGHGGGARWITSG